MAHPLLNRILREEGSQFQTVQNRWRPQNLLLLPQVRLLLHDIERRYFDLAAAEEEFATLDRRNLYVALIKRMRLSVRLASFTWKADQFSFIQAISSFYKDYSHVLRLLKSDALRGALAEQPS